MLVVFGVQVEQLVDDLPLLHATVADGRQDGVPVPEAVLAQDDLLIGRLHQIGELEAVGLGVGLDQLLALGDVLLLVFPLEPLVDLVAGGGAPGDAEPVQAGSLGIGAGEDLNAVAVFDLVIDVDQLVVDLGPGHAVADRRVDRVGKIDRRGAGGEVLDLAAGGEAVDIVRKQIQVALEQVHEFPVVRHVLLPFEDLTEPGQLLFLAGLFDLLAAPGLLVFPVGGNTVFRRAVHFIGPDLDLEGLAGGADQGGVQGLIHVRLGHGDIVLEAPGDGLVHLVDGTQDGIAVPDGPDDDADREEVVDLLDGFILVEHLAVDAEQVLDAAVHLALDAGVANMLFDLLGDLLDIALALTLALLHLFHKVIVYVRIEVFEAEVVQFDLDLGDSEPVGDGRIDVQGLLGDALLFFLGHELKGPHIVQAVRQLDQDDPDILGHGQEHLAQVSGLHLLLDLGPVPVVPGEFEFFQFGDTVHQKGHIRAEFLLDLLPGQDRVLHDVVEKSRRDGLLVHFQIGQDHRDAEGVDDIGFPRFAQLSLVRAAGDLIGALNQRDIIGRMISAHALDQAPVKILRTVVLPNAFNLTGVDGDPALDVVIALAVCHGTPLETYLR